MHMLIENEIFILSISITTRRAAMMVGIQWGGGVQYAHGIVWKVRSAHILEQVTTSSPSLNLG